MKRFLPYLIAALVLAGCEADAVTNLQVTIPPDTVKMTVTITDTLNVTDTLTTTVEITDTVTVETTDTLIVEITDTLVVEITDTLVQTDTVMVEVTDTLVMEITDTLVVTDTLTQTDTVTVEVTDTLFETDTLGIVKDSVEYELSDYVTDDDKKQTILGTFDVPASEVWVKLELSGRHQKDEAFALLGNGIPISEYACPVIPDNPTLGTDWVRIGTVDAGQQVITAQHAKLWNCYPSNSGFITPNSVHFKAVKFVYDAF